MISFKSRIIKELAEQKPDKNGNYYVNINILPWQTQHIDFTADSQIQNYSLQFVELDINELYLTYKKGA